MSSADEVVEIVLEVINSFEEEDGFQHHEISFSWNRGFITIICTNSEKR